MECVQTWLPLLRSLGKDVSWERPYQRLSVFPTESASFHLQHGEDVKQKELLIFREIRHVKEEVPRMTQIRPSSQ